MTGLTHVGGVDMGWALAHRRAAVVASNTGITGGTVIKHHTQPAGGAGMTGIT